MLRERPERFSMLNAKSHLKGWLRFADDDSLHDRALTGARALDHRTTDAVEILIDKYDEESRWKLLRYLTALDLDATMPLCANLLSELHGQFTKVLSGFARQSRDADDADAAARAAVTKDHTGSAIEYFTWLNAKLDSIEAMPSSRVSLFFKNASYDERSAATTRNR